MIYPNVFPIRRPDRQPKPWEMRVGYFCIDTFTPVTSNVFRAARQSCNAAWTGASLILDGSHLVYVVGRPPGHHAERSVFGGFCYFNNAAVAAHYLSKNDARVAILDVDYHHGNGTQQIFYERKDVFVASIHGHPTQAYPYFAGFADELGDGEGAGTNRNFPLFPEVDDTRYLSVLKTAIGHIKRFRPDVLILSAGLDIMRGDPTGTFSVSAAGVREIGATLGRLGLPTLVIQEGGCARFATSSGVLSR